MFKKLKGLFGEERDSGFIPPDPIPRRIFIKGLKEAQVLTLLKEYETLGPTGPGVHCRLAGPMENWFVLIPADDIHSYFFHNLIAWFQGVGDIISEDSIGLSLGTTGNLRYYLFQDPENDDQLVGYMADGKSIAVYPPENIVFRDIKIQPAPVGIDEFLMTRGIPAALRGADPEGEAGGSLELLIHLEPLGNQMNPHLETAPFPREKLRGGRLL